MFICKTFLGFNKATHVDDQSLLGVGSGNDNLITNNTFCYFYKTKNHGFKNYYNETPDGHHDGMCDNNKAVSCSFFKRHCVSQSLFRKEIRS